MLFWKSSGYFWYYKTRSASFSANLVSADEQSLLAYHLEALVPSAASPQVRAAPQRLSPGKDIVFFTVGQLSGRTLVLYMKRKGVCAAVP